MAIGTPVSIATAGQTTNTGGTRAITLTAGVAIGDYVIVGAWRPGEGTTGYSAVDSRGNTYTVALERKHATQSPNAGLLIAKVTTALLIGDTITVTYPGGSYFSLRGGGAISISGLDLTTVTDVTDFEDSGGGASTAATSGAFSTTGADEIIVSLLATSGVSASGTPGTWTEMFDVANASGSAQMGYLAAATAGSYTVTETLSAAAQWMMLSVALKGAGGATNATVTAVPADATGALPIPGVSSGADGSVTAPAATGAGDVPSPAASAGANVTAVPADATGELPLAGNELSSEVAPSPAAGTGALPAPTVSGTSAGTVTAVPADGTGDLADPAISAGAGVTSPAADGTGDVPAPAASAGSGVSSGPLDGAGTVVAPDVSSVSSVTPEPDTPTSLALDAHSTALALDVHAAVLTLDVHAPVLVLDAHRTSLELDAHVSALALDS